MLNIFGISALEWLVTVMLNYIIISIVLQCYKQTPQEFHAFCLLRFTEKLQSGFFETNLHLYLSASLCFLFPGVLLPLHRVCCLHHAALLHESGHYRQRHHLLLTHCHPKRLPGLQSHRAGTSRLAGKTDNCSCWLWNFWTHCWNLEVTQLPASMVDDSVVSFPVLFFWWPK